MIPAPAGAARNTRSAAWPVTRPLPMPARPAPPAAVPARRPSLASYLQERDEVDELTEASNAVVDMVQAGDLDAAEQAARDLLARFPDVHDGYDRLGMVYEARGDHVQAADYYRRAITVIRSHPDALRSRVRGHVPKARRPARNPGGRRRRLSLLARPLLQPRPVLGGVKASTPAARSLLDPNLRSRRSGAQGRHRGMVLQSRQGILPKRLRWARSADGGRAPKPQIP